MLAVVPRRELDVAAATRPRRSPAPATAWSATGAAESEPPSDAGTKGPFASRTGRASAWSVEEGFAVVWSPVDGSSAAPRGPAEPFVAFAITYARVP